MSSDLATTRSTIAEISTGKDANQDGWMMMWCNTNWGDLLQPAPLSIALLGSIMIIASSTDDFSLINADAPVPYVWECAKFPGSFKACLMQMVNEGYTAFGTADAQMTRIHNASGQIPDTIKEAVFTIMTGTPTEIQALLPDQIQAALDLANICVEAATTCEEEFKGIQKLAAEMVLACTNQVGTTEQKIKANEIQLAILEERRKSEAELVKTQKETRDHLQKAFLNAEEDFHDAVKKVPTTMEIVALQVVECVTQLATTAGNAFIKSATLKTDAAMAGIGMLQNQTGGGQQPAQPTQPTQPGGTGTETKPATPTQNTQASPANLSDPGLQEANKVLQLANTLQVLVSGGPNSSPDWNQLRGNDKDGKSGALYVQMSLQTTIDRLDKTKPISAELLPIVESAVAIAKGIVDVAKSASSSEDSALDPYKPKITTLIANAQQMVTKVNSILSQSGSVGTGPATPPTPEKVSPGAAVVAVQNSQYLVNETRGHLEATGKSYIEATNQLLKQQELITKTIADLTSISLTNTSIKAMLPVLKKAIGAFTTLQAQFSQISQFFKNVASLLQDILLPSVTKWTKTMQNTMTLGGVTIGDLSRQLIYAQMMLPLRVSMLAEKISAVYLEVSDKYIMPAQRSVGGMLEFSSDNTEQGKAALRASLEKKQATLQKQSQDASKQIAALVAKDQKAFAAAIKTRLDKINTTLQDVIPAVREPVPKAITDVTSASVKQYTEKRGTAAKANPMYDVGSMM
ncbi:hypothetical protein BDW22DRAFT_1361941 [Trametopsis cervina]|nr:hypothetical protein BDW22DRAFT_1361941 [Trametopsis cervina]